MKRSRVQFPPSPFFSCIGLKKKAKWLEKDLNLHLCVLIWWEMEGFHIKPPKDFSSFFKQNLYPGGWRRRLRRARRMLYYWAIKPSTLVLFLYTIDRRNFKFNLTVKKTTMDYSSWRCYDQLRSAPAWMAERSKAVDLSSIIVRCVGSNPTPGIFVKTKWPSG